MDRTELETYLNQFLEVDNYLDYCINGLQVEGCTEIRSVVTGVSVSERLLKTAIDREADAIIVHHGLFWRNTPHPFAVAGIMKNRLKILLENGVNLFGYHLPLDGHSEIGNNALIARKLSLQDVSIVPLSGDTAPIAAVGDLPKPVSISEFTASSDRVLQTEGRSLHLNNDDVSRVFVLSGGGSDYARDAAQTGADMLVTGELKEVSVRAAEECGLNLYAAGHYNSEKWGIQALGEHIAKKFRIETEFVDIPNPV